MLIQTRVDDKTAKAVRAAAKREGLSVAAWLRRAALQALEVRRRRRVFELHADHGHEVGGTALRVKPPRRDVT